MGQPVALLALASLVTTAALVSVAEPTGAAVPRPVPKVKPFVAPTPAVVRLRPGPLPLAPRDGAKGATVQDPRATAADGTTVSLVPDAPPGDPRSVWDITYNGFVAGSAPQQAFKAAVDIWARIIASPVHIKVTATFTGLGAGVLGSAAPCATYSSGIGDGNTLYPSALADALLGADQSEVPAYKSAGYPSCDINAQFSSNNSSFYFGTDGLPPAGKVDFESVVLHELGHGLGFLGSMDVSSGIGRHEARPYRYDRFAYDSLTDGTPLLAFPNESPDLAAKLQNNSVFWGGEFGINGNIPKQRPKLYAPASWEPGSSFSHLDEDTYSTGDPDSLMTPYFHLQEAVHNPGEIAVGMFHDMGWDAALPARAPASPPDAPTNVVARPGNAKAVVSWTAPSSNGATITSYTVTADPGPATCTTSATSCTVTGLTNGQAYTFTVVATNSEGPGKASQASNSVMPDGVAPTVASSALPLVSLTTPVLRWSGADKGSGTDGTGASGIASYTLKYQIAPYNAGFGAYSTVSTTATYRAVAVAKGSTICFSVVGRDIAGNVSASSARRCTGVGMDDRSLARSSSWASIASADFYAGTETTIARSGATLTRTGISTRRISLVASKCSTCGTVGIYWNGVLLKQISLRATTTLNRQVITAYDLGSIKSGTLVIKTLNAYRTSIDGVGLGRF